ncbi:glycosyltransferase family 2 protein, partial [bacterium]|nr:glycosyltransferase family 2 protein [candidate division CSSED10-310 bacterium]
MRVSVIIPAFNGERTIGNTLESLVAERDSETEVVVIDDASEDRTGRIAAEFDILYHRLTVRSGPSVARNRGARLAQGDILLFIDADVMVQPGWLNSIRSGFA